MQGSATWAAAARLFADAGAKVVALQDTGSIHNPAGWTCARRKSWSLAHRTLIGAPDSEPIDNADFWGVDADILVAAAMENQITTANAGRIRPASSPKAPTARPARRPT